MDSASVNICVVNPPKHGGGHLIMTDTETITIKGVCTQVTLNLVLLQFLQGNPVTSPVPAFQVTPIPNGDWQFLNIPMAIAPNGVMSFCGISLRVDGDDFIPISSCVSYTPPAVFNPASVSFTVNPPSEAAVVIKYRVQLFNLTLAKSLVLDPTIRDQGSGA